MIFDTEALPTGDVYKLLTACVTPRPIAWVSTQDRQGRVNAAPYSFFNAMGPNPPTVAIGMQADPVKGFKDSPRNVLETGEFVVNLVPKALDAQMNLTAVDAPTGVEELKLAGLTTAPSSKIAPPRIAESPVSFECVNLSSVVTGPAQVVVIGRVVAIHVADPYVEDADRCWIDGRALDLIGRSYGAEYILTRERYDMPRPDWQQWIADHPEHAPEDSDDG